MRILVVYASADGSTAEIAQRIADRLRERGHEALVRPASSVSNIDGMDAVDTLYANTRNNPIEDVESHLPLRVTQYELLEDGGGAGIGLGVITPVRRHIGRRSRDRALAETGCPGRHSHHPLRWRE